MPDTIIRFAPSQRPAARSDPGTYYCKYLWDHITVLSDGRVTCGFDDPYGLRSYGNVRDMPVRDIFNGAGMRERRERLLSGTRCQACHLFTRVADAGPSGLPSIPDMPRGLIIETTIRCQLRCRNTSCDINNDRSSGVREEPFLSMELFRKVIDQVAPGLKAMWFFNYGEPFLHPRAIDMLAYARAAMPEVSVATSTNGLLIGKGDRARRIVEEHLVDWMNFTIAGCDDASYQVYHKGGSFEQAIEGMRRILEERARLGRKLPLVRWRYLLFNWNDSDEQIARARALAREIGVDQFTFFLCSAPLEGRTRRRAPGTPGFEAIRDAIDYEFHYVADPFADIGLYPPEYDAHRGVYCWTGRRALLSVASAASTVSVSLARPHPAASQPTTVRVRTPWEERVVDLPAADWGRFTFDVPADARGACVALEVEVDDLHVPMRHSGSEDLRELGAIVSLDFADDLDAPELALDAAAKAALCARAAPGATRPSNAQGPCIASVAAISPAWLVAQLYRDILGREGDPGGLAWWVERVEQSGRPAEVAAGLLASEECDAGLGRVCRFVLGVCPLPHEALVRWCLERVRAGTVLDDLAAVLVRRAEFRLRYGTLDDESFARRLHEDLMGRPRAQDDPAFSGDRARYVAAVSQTAAFGGRVHARVLVMMAYVTLLKRMPDASAWVQWTDRLNGGTPLQELVEAIVGAPEFLARFRLLAA